MKFKEIYIQSSLLLTHKKATWSIANQWPEAKITYVPSHWNIPQLVNRSPEEWLRTKHEVLVLGAMKTLTNTPNGRSTDFIAPSHANGCWSSCTYCYVARRKGGSNPLTVFVNIEDILNSILDHAKTLGPKTPNQCDPFLWTYDIGCNNDVSLDAAISINPLILIEGIKQAPNAKLSFATKTVNLDPFLSVSPKGQTRIRFSLMPENIRKLVDIRTSDTESKLEAMNILAEHGYEIHANFSPVILYGDNQWRKDWVTLWQQMDKILSKKVKNQLKCEIIFLTHSAQLHGINKLWHYKGEEILWAPDLQQPKFDKPDVLVYKYDLKKVLVESFCNGLSKYLPYCEIRYAF